MHKFPRCNPSIRTHSGLRVRAWQLERRNSTTLLRYWCSTGVYCISSLYSLYLTVKEHPTANFILNLQDHVRLGTSDLCYRKTRSAWEGQMILFTETLLEGTLQVSTGHSVQKHTHWTWRRWTKTWRIYIQIHTQNVRIVLGDTK